MKTDLMALQLPVAPDLYLRKASPADATALYQIIDRDRAYLREWLPFIDFSQTAADTEAFLTYVSSNTSELVYCLMHEEEVAGLIGLKSIDTLNKKLEIGYWLAQDKQGKGIMRRCCHTLLQFVFEKLQMNRVELRVGVGNTRSSRVPESLGFTFEGIQRQGELLNGSFHDLQVYSLLRSEFKG